MDFTINKYREFLGVLISKGYVFQTFSEFLNEPREKVIILRHDVDKLPENSLKFAEIQSNLGLKGTYYFRVVPESWDEKIISKIADFGHEIGYHYENLKTCNGNIDDGIKDFKNNLRKLRKVAPVATICMHGSPRSKYDSKALWEKNNYKDYNVIGDPYFEIDFDQVLYLTDTGRMWDGDSRNVNVRDVIKSSFNQSYHTTDQIIKAINRDNLPNQIMFTFHPQRWTDSNYAWYKEFVSQKLRNIVKSYFYVKKEKN